MKDMIRTLLFLVLWVYEGCHFDFIAAYLIPRSLFHIFSTMNTNMVACPWSLNHGTSRDTLFYLAFYELPTL